MTNKNIKYDKDVNNYTPQQLEKFKLLAKKRFIESEGAVSVKVLSRVARVPQEYIRKWIKEENWENLTVEEPGDRITLSDKTKTVIEEDADNYELTEQERLFCYHYLKTFNATTAAARAGYSSAFCYQKGCKLMKDEKIKNFLKHIKAQRDEELFIDSVDIIKQYVSIAFADITDIVRFKGDILSLRSSSEVDGSLISEISQGKDGFKVKLHDKLEALKRLEKYCILDIEKEKLKLQKAKVLMEIEAARNTNKTNADVGILKDKMEARRKVKEDKS